MSITSVNRYKTLLQLLILFSYQVHAESDSNLIGKEQKYNSGWLLNLDNDILAESDRDYTVVLR
jgi:hypothetical protein